MDDLTGRKELLEASGLKEGYVLDIGMGDCGCMSFFLAKRGFKVVGIDHSPDAVHDSRKDAEEIKFSGTFEAKLANAENLPFPDNEFDAIFAYHSLHHMDNVEKVIDEMFRACKEEGLILISDLHEEGRKVYEHESDSGEFLKTVETFLAKHTKSVRRAETKYNMIFVCKKNTKSQIYDKEKGFISIHRKFCQKLNGRVNVSGKIPTVEEIKNILTA